MSDQPKPVLKACEDFGTEAFPIRPSSIAKLVKCNMQLLLDAVGEPDAQDEGGVAAQTGSLTHSAVAAFHRTHGTVADRTVAGLQAMQADTSKFPRGELSEAKIYFAHYANDPINQNARILAVERPVKLRLTPHKADPTQRDIVIEGTLDQIREVDGELRVYDYKTGQGTGLKMIHDYAYQLSAYLLAARASGFDCKESWIIRGYSYRQKNAILPSPVGTFWRVPVTVESADILLDRLRSEVARIRGGDAQFGPGEHCTFCPMRTPDSCIPIAKRRLGF